ncbi:RAMP superfamily CRISPR-associated protein [Thermovibrio sp.]
MEWYKLVLEQIQPIHIGKFNWGVISETEIFIPGQTVWGALVNAYLQSEKSFSEEIQEKFRAITNFFPSFDGSNVLEPVYVKGRFAYKVNDSFITEEEFRFYFVSAEFKTSIEPFTLTAKEEQLYEFEFILPKPQRKFVKNKKNLDCKENLRWIGLLGINEREREVKNFLEKVSEIFIGGDVRYGYGLVKVNLTELEDKELRSWNLDEDGKFVSGMPLRNFFEFRNSLEFKGEIRLVPELEFFENQPIVNDVKFYITPGSVLDNGKSAGNFLLKKGKFVLNG